MSFELEYSGFELEIDIAELSDLKLHEEVIDHLLDDLSESIENDGMIRDSVIVDKNTGVVLDGMHRVSATEKLGYDKIPACFVDYQDPRVKVGSWCRVFSDFPMDNLRKISNELGFKSTEIGQEDIEELLSKRKSELVLASEEKNYSLYRGCKSIKEIYDSALKFEERLIVRGFEPVYEPDEDIEERLGPQEVSILLPSAKKTEVIDIAFSNSVFDYKTTRHVIPARPLRVDFPLEFLEEDVSSAEEELVSRLKERDVEQLPAGSSFEGREYKEELFVFS